MESFQIKAVQNPPNKTQKIQVLLRALVVVASLTAALLTFTSKQSSIVYGIQFDAKYSYSQDFVFLVYANLIASVFTLLSLIFVIILHHQGSDPRNYFVMFLHDTVMLVLVISATAAASAIGLLGKHGNNHTGWIAICNNFGKFCNKMTVALIFSYLASLLLFVLTIIQYKLKEIHVPSK